MNWEERYSGTCSKMQFSPCREGAKNGKRRSKPTGERGRGSRAAKLKQASWTHLQMELTNLCSATGVQQLKEKQPKWLGFCYFCSFPPEYQVSRPRDEGGWGISARAEEDAKGVKKQESRNGAEERSEKQRQKGANFPANPTWVSSPLLSPPQPVKTPGTAQQILA